MVLYAEVWKARQTWLDLPFEERKAYLDTAGASIGPLLALPGVQISAAFNAAEVAHRANFRYLMVWHLPDLESVTKLQDAVEAAGWHQYFEQFNAGGEAAALDGIFKDMLTL